MRQWEVLKILVKRGRRRADDIEMVLGNGDVGNHRKLLALIAGRGRLKGLFLLFGVFTYKRASFHVSFESRALATLIVTVLFLVASFCIVPFDTTEEAKAFPVTPFLFFLSDFASLGLEVGVVDRGSVLFSGGSSGTETSPVSG